jgi:hypothetical protein
MTGIRRYLWPKSLAGKAGVVAIFFGVTLVVAYLAACKYTSERLAEAWKLSDEFGLPNDFKALLGEPVPPERNMAMPLDEASTIAQTFQTNLRMGWKDVEDRIYTEDPKYIAAFEKLLADPAYENALIEADRRTEYYSPVVITPSLYSIMLNYVQTRREIARAEQAISRMLVSKGKRDEAVMRLVRLMRLMRGWEDREPFLIAALVNIAVRSVLIGELNRVLRDGGPLPPALHDDIEREAAETEKILKALPRIGQTEKIASMESYDSFSPLAKTPLLRPLADNDRAYMLRYLNRWMKSSAMPYSEAKAELTALDDDLKRNVGDPVSRIMHAGAAMLLPAVIMARTAFDRLIAYSRCLRIVNAMARRGDFKADPATLGLPPECLVDPFDGKPIRIKQTVEGTIVYSVGPDQKDDGGQFDATGGKGWDVGLGPTPKPEKK